MKQTYANWKMLKNLSKSELDMRWNNAIDKFKNLPADFDKVIKKKHAEDSNSIKTEESDKGVFIEVTSEILGFCAQLEVHKNKKSGNIRARYLMFDDNGMRSVIRELNSL